MANIVALGLLIGISKVIPSDALQKAVLQRVPKGTGDLNQKAFSAGIEAAGEIIAKGGTCL